MKCDLQYLQDCQSTCSMAQLLSFSKRVLHKESFHHQSCDDENSESLVWQVCSTIVISLFLIMKIVERLKREGGERECAFIYVQ